MRYLIYKSKHGVCPCGQKLGSAWKIFLVTARSLWSKYGGVWTKIGQCLEDSFSHCPFLVEQIWWCMFVVGRAERPRQPLREAGRGAISIKEILGENRGPASNQKNTICFKNYFYYITYLKNYNFFKKENRKK